ncbi:MAG: hypothetical protein KA715_14800 [Xanthomonadaceae bacterium]|nr:hypothetical protein [Xanthomonadaceae bacterium]
MMKSIFLVIGSLINVAQAQTDLTSLLAAFDSSWPVFNERMQASQSLQNSMELPLSEDELNYADCEQLEIKISAQYPISPFDVKFNNGNFSFKLCGNNAKHSFNNQKLKTMEVLASYILNREITLDANNRLTHWQELWTSRKDGSQKFNYEATVDPSGNIYAHYWNEDVTDSRRKIQGPYHKMTYISADGLTPEPWSLLIHTDKIDPKNNRKLYRMSLPMTQDWTAVFAPLTFFKMGAVYQYNQTLDRNPKNFLSIRVFEFMETRQCIIGSKTLERKTALIPADYSAYTKCALQ